MSLNKATEKDMAVHGVVGDRMLRKLSDVKKGDPALDETGQGVRAAIIA